MTIVYCTLWMTPATYSCIYTYWFCVNSLATCFLKIDIAGQACAWDTQKVFSNILHGHIAISLTYTWIICCRRRASTHQCESITGWKRVNVLQLHITLFYFTSSNRSMSKRDLKEHVLFTKNVVACNKRSLCRWNSSNYIFILCFFLMFREQLGLFSSWYNRYSFIYKK
jgi:hypothetical protein